MMSLEGFLSQHFYYMGQVQVGYVAEVLRFDGARMEADVLPLLKSRTFGIEVEYQRLNNVPVLCPHGSGSYIKPTYRSGDLVYVTVAANGHDEALQGGKDDDFGQRFNLANSVIIGGIFRKKESVPDPIKQKKGLTIGDNKSYVNFSNEGLAVNGEKPLIAELNKLKARVNAIFDAANKSTTGMDAGFIDFQTRIRAISGLEEPTEAQPASAPTPDAEFGKPTI